MTARDPSDWTPEPELLAAYFDGELNGRPELRARVQDWLDRHAEAREELAGYRHLAQLWQETSPEEPAAETWRRVLARIVRAKHEPPRPVPARGRRATALIITAACVALLVGAWAWQRVPQKVPPGQPDPPPSEVVEIFPVATASEVAILSVDGADTGSLVVGELPVRGPLELADPGEVVLTSVQPDARDNMMPHVLLQGPSRPMIWARLDPEDAEP